MTRKIFENIVLHSKKTVECICWSVVLKKRNSINQKKNLGMIMNLHKIIKSIFVRVKKAIECICRTLHHQKKKKTEIKSIRSIVLIKFRNDNGSWDNFWKYICTPEEGCWMYLLNFRINTKSSKKWDQQSRINLGMMMTRFKIIKNIFVHLTKAVECICWSATFKKSKEK